MGLAAEAVRDVLGAQPGEVGADVAGGDAGGVTIAGSFDPLAEVNGVGGDCEGESPSANLALVKATRAALRGTEGGEPEYSRVEPGVLR